MITQVKLLQNKPEEAMNTMQNATDGSQAIGIAQYMSYNYVNEFLIRLQSVTTLSTEINRFKFIFSIKINL